VGVLQNAGEVSLAETFTVTPEELARAGADLAGANWSVAVGANRAANEVERLLTPQANSASILYRQPKLRLRLA